MITKLGMGQVRTANEILAAETLGVAASTGTLEGDAQAESLTIKPEVVTKKKGNCWSEYLDKNPAMKASSLFPSGIDSKSCRI